MNDWTAGYVADITYTHGYYQELNPLRIQQAFLNAGLVYPEVNHACELGFGQGITVNLHAAASSTTWYGTDFNPAQAGFAQEFAQSAGNGAVLGDESFAEFAQRTDLPDFDFIGLHGIWSWISEENRSVIVDFLRRKLKVGGVLYISYNTQPGWAGFAPMRHLMAEHAERMGAAGLGYESRVNGALDFMERMLGANPAYARAIPQVAERLKRMKDQNRQYLLHEYFNDVWQPMHFAEMVKWLGAAKINFAVSATYNDHVDALCLTPDQQRFLKEIPDATFRETVRDFMVNQQFRRDYWVKGARKLGALKRSELQQAQRVVLTTHRAEVPMKIKASLGEVELNEAIYAPILDLLANHKPQSLTLLAQGLKGKNVSPGQLLQAVQVLLASGHLSPAQGEAAVEQVRQRTTRVNRHLINQARESGEVAYLVSPVTGGGVSAGRFHQLFMGMHREGMKQPEDWAKAVWKTISGQNEKLLKDGKPLSTPEENLAELVSMAKKFAEKRLPVLQALQAV